MVPVAFKEANVIYTAPLDWDADKYGPCLDIHVRRIDGMMQTVWEPTELELQQLNKGGKILLVTWGDNFAPAALAIYRSGNGEAD